MTYTWRALDVADTARWSAFTKIVADADDTDETYSADDLAEELEDPETDPTQDTIAVEDAQATLVAVGQVMAPMVRPDGTIRADFFGFVHPTNARTRASAPNWSAAWNAGPASWRGAAPRFARADSHQRRGAADRRRGRCSRRTATTQPGTSTCSPVVWTAWPRPRIPA